MRIEGWHVYVYVSAEDARGRPYAVSGGNYATRERAEAAALRLVETTRYAVGYRLEQRQVYASSCD